MWGYSADVAHVGIVHASVGKFAGHVFCTLMSRTFHCCVHHKCSYVRYCQPHAWSRDLSVFPVHTDAAVCLVPLVTDGIMKRAESCEPAKPNHTRAQLYITVQNFKQLLTGLPCTICAAAFSSARHAACDGQCNEYGMVCGCSVCRLGAQPKPTCMI